MGDLAAEAWGEMLGRTADAYADYVKAMADVTARIAAARDKFAKAPEGPAADAAWKELKELLDGKDMMYLINAVVQGLDAPDARLVFHQRGTVGTLAIGGDIDGGIPGPGRSIFARTVEEIRAELKNMGCQVMQGSARLELLTFQPRQFREALTKNQEQWSTYQMARDRAEYLHAGKRPPKLSDPRPFVIMALELRRDTGAAEAASDYESLLVAIGPKKLQETATAVAQAAQDERGNLTDKALAQLGLISSTDVPPDTTLVSGKTADGKMVIWGVRPLSALRGMWTRDNPRIAAMFAMAEALRVGYATAWQRLERIEAAVGKQRMESALAEFHEAPRRAENGMLVTPVPPGDQFWMYRPFERLQAALLAGDDSKAQVRYFIAINPNTPDAAAIDQKYQELAKLKGEQELLRSVASLRNAGWKPRSVGVPTDDIVVAIGKLLGPKGEPNIHYLQWAGFGPGTTATYDVELTGMKAMDGGTRHIKREVRVVSANADSITLEVTESKQQQNGTWTDSAAKIEQISAYDQQVPGNADVFKLALPLVPGGWLGFDPIGPKVGDQGTATILIGGDVVKCARSIWQESQRETKLRRGGGGPGQADYELRGKDSAEVWTNSKLPGWIAKAVRSVPGGRTIIRLTAFDATAPAAEVAVIAAKASTLDWMRAPDKLISVPFDREVLQRLDPGSRAWLLAPVGSSVTHLLHYKGPSQARTDVQEELDARAVSTLVEKDPDMALMRATWTAGDNTLQPTEAELGPANPEIDYVGTTVTWLASNRKRFGKLDLSAVKPSRATVTINGQPLDAIVYHHISLPPAGWAGLRVQQLILSASVPGAIVHLSVQRDPGVGGIPYSLTYSLEGLDPESLPDIPALTLKPKGGNFAVEQELMVENRGNWEKGKILRFTQLPNDAGGHYLIQVGRNPVWYNEAWLREHSRPVSDAVEAASAAPALPEPEQAKTSPRQQSPHPRGVKPALKASDWKPNETPSGSLAVGSKVQFDSRGTLLEGTVVRIRGEGRRQLVEIQYRDPRQNQIRQTWVNARDVQKLPASE